MGVDDDADCVEHVWVLRELHLSVERGTEQCDVCTRCGAVRYAGDGRPGHRPKLRPVR